MRYLLLAALTFLVPALARAQYPSPTVQNLTVLGWQTGGGSSGVDARAPAYAGGVKCDGVTDDTTALTAALTAAESATSSGASQTLLLPTGTCLINPITITGQVVIQGQGRTATVLMLAAGATAPAVTVQTAGPALPSGGPTADVQLRDLQISSKTGKVGSANAHGLVVATGTLVPTRITLNNVTIYAMPGDGLRSVGLNGWVEAYNIELFNNGGNGLDANSVNDWHFFGGVIGVNGASGALLSGVSQFVFSGTNIYANALYNLNLYSAAGIYTGNLIFENCMFDLSNQVGVSYGLQGTGGASFIGDTFATASQSSPGTYSDVQIASTANNLAVFSGNYWGGHLTGNPVFKEKLALEFLGTTQTVVVDGNNHFINTNALDTNRPQSAYWASPPTGLLNLPTGFKAVTPTQFDGYELNNGTNTVAKLFGDTAANDGGHLVLLYNGTTAVQIAADAPSFITTPVSIGTTTTAPSGGLRVAGAIIAPGLPTSCTSQPTGTLANLSGVLNVCP